MNKFIDECLSDMETDEIKISTYGEIRFSRSIYDIVKSKNGKSQLEAIGKLSEMLNLKGEK